MFKPAAAPIRGLAYTPDGRLLVAYADGSLFSRTAAGAFKRIRRGPAIASMRLSRDGRLVALGGYDGSVVLVDAVTGAVRTLATRGTATWSLAFTATGEQLAAGSDDGRLRLFDLVSGKERAIGAHRLNIWSLDVDPRRGLLASGSFDHRIRLWDMATASARPTTARHDQAVVALAFAPGGGLLASGGDDATLRLWDDNLRPTWRRDAGQHVYAVTFTPDGRWIITGGREASGLQALFRLLFGTRFGGGNGTTIRFWRPADGAMVEAVGAQPNDVFALAIAPGGKLLASGADDGSIAIWRLENGAVR